MNDRVQLLEVTDLSDENTDLSIGVEDGPGGRLRVEERRLGSLRSSVSSAAKLARREAGKVHARLASGIPAAVRADSGRFENDPDRIEMDFDVVEDGERSENRPRLRARQVRVVVMAKKGSPTRPRTR